MLNIDIKGINSVGRMYRPQSVVNSEKRGMKISTKYKSNFGGDINKIAIGINLEYSISDKTERLVIDVEQLNPHNDVSLAICKEGYNSISKNEVLSKHQPVKIETYRTLLKLDGYTLKHKSEDKPIQLKLVEGILYCDFFIDSISEREQDKAYMAIYPTVINDTEYLFIEFESHMPTLIRCNKGIYLY